MKTVRVSWNWHGEEGEVLAGMQPADPDVGIPGPYPDWIELYGEEGKEILLNEEEYNNLFQNETLCQRLQDAYETA